MTGAASKANQRISSGRGGARPGAGRKPGSQNAETAKNRATISAIARKHGEWAITTLRVIAANGETPAAARVAALNSILDRAYGRPQQSVSVEDNRTARDMSDAELMAIATGRAPASIEVH